MSRTGQRAWVMPTPKPRATHGGKRAGAGRKRAPDSVEASHLARTTFNPAHPMHVVMRVLRDIGRLRRGPVFEAIQRAAARTAERTDFRIVHFSVQHNHIHLIVEAESADALSAGMHKLSLAIAHAINKSLGRKGKVFACRYHATPLTTPTQVRNAIAYVLNNWRRHNEDERALESRSAPLDPYSSAVMFDGWKELGRVELPSYLMPQPVQRPTTWLLRDGWRKAKRPISMFATPGLDERP